MEGGKWFFSTRYHKCRRLKFHDPLTGEEQDTKIQIPKVYLETYIFSKTKDYTYHISRAEIDDYCGFKSVLSIQYFQNIRWGQLLLFAKVLRMYLRETLTQQL
jgi:hypothetical protein